MNSPGTIGWVVLGVYIFVAIINVTDIIINGMRKRRERAEVRSNDDTIFATVEEARRDFI